MPNKMLIDSSHPEETRVVVVHGSRIEEFDFESQDKKQLKGNIYLARVTRVEPSLQAAFVEYGGNRHGFLAFSEIHPDYYQIPVADRQALLRADAEAARDEDDEAENEDRHDRSRGRRRRRGRNRGRDGESTQEAAGEESAGAESSSDETDVEDLSPEDSTFESASGTEASTEAGEPAASDEQASGDDGGADEPAASEDDEAGGRPAAGGPSMAAAIDTDVISEERETGLDAAPAQGEVEEVSEVAGDEDHEIESVGAEDALEEAQSRRRPMRRQYKIQEVIKRRQILLVQVVKEERGNKGAALTTYLSLAGRYSVLMPNTARGGGISRKITSAQDRKRLKEIVQELEVPAGMGVILRTAGESRTKAEIRRDYEYLMRLWENVRTLTLQSTAPSLVYEEGSLIKRSVRDLYNKDIDEIIVGGDEGYREAKDFMRMLMPSHAKVVQPYRDTVPLFVRYGVEAQLDRMLQPQVTLKSGGYIIINQTEALVSIDVNSGRSTREHSIEETALHTNLEAAEEIARQLRLRDLAGLIVIDFIDMEENRNNRSVEKRLKEHLKNDRARIQLGRISHFGLMEMSRQRIRASVLESTMKPCPHCGGTGHVRSDSSVALLVVRAIEEFLLKDSRSHIVVRTPASTAMYVLNHKRSTLTEMETRFGLTITIEPDETVGTQHYAIQRGAIAEKPAVPLAPATPLMAPEPDDVDIVEEESEEEEVASDLAEREDGGPPQEGEHRDRRKRKRRRRRGGRDRDHSDRPQGQAAAQDDSGATAENAETEDETETVEGASAPVQAGDEGERKKRRRGKRGGRRNRGEGEHDAADAQGGEEAADGETTGATDTVETPVGEAAETLGEAAPLQVEQVEAETASVAESEPAEPVKKLRAPRRKAAAETTAVEGEAAPAEAEKKPARRSRKKSDAVAEAAALATATEAVAAVETPAATAEVDASPAETAAVEAEASPEEAASGKADADSTAQAAVEASEPAAATPAAAEPDRPKKSGWWQRRGFF